MAKSEQPADTGSGPFLERRYRLDIVRPRRTAAELMQQIQCDVAHFSPDLLADFEKTAGAQHGLAAGDEFKIKILGPWNGEVRVTDISPTAFEFITLDGHPEAGRIRFSLLPHPDRADAIRFEIHSWARSRDGLVAFMYDKLGAGKRVQEQTWRIFCERVAEASGGATLSEVQIDTFENGAVVSAHG
ncbi:DUF1990 family protein [Hymenobacter sp. NBH84]|uniref:DUF1990 family protein n=1 Tax=Hymenobacter sp. NBH84 TaxID=2596915 RepID=UPI00162891E6|nr:DUF1990 family protein [Hymenobacter sp. NBH84]QNE38218.1 DUF1990 family protein [Hymenobacter sp. NBH84]